MPIDPSLLEIHTHTGPAFQPLVHFQSWRVALLNFTDHLRPENLHDMQRHDETDEVFVLLRGGCILFIGDGRSEAGQITAVDLQPLTLYNVRQGTWHNHTLSEDASVLVVENRETTLENSPFCALGEDQRRGILEETARIWGDRMPSPGKRPPQ